MAAEPGNAFTHFMHRRTLDEIRTAFSRAPAAPLVYPEEAVLLEPLHAWGAPRLGRFDFLVDTPHRERIGFEVLTRPSKGKLKKKLAYARGVEKFVFVLPRHALSLYRKPQTKVFHKKAHLSFLPREFSNPRLLVWLFDPQTGGFCEKGTFSQLFNVER